MGSDLGKFLTLNARDVSFSTAIDVALVADDVTVVLFPNATGNDLVGIGNGVQPADGQIIIIANGSRSKSIDVIGESGSAANAFDRFHDSSTIDPDETHAFIYQRASNRWTRFL